MPNELFGLQAESKPLVGKFARVPTRQLHRGFWCEIVDQSCGGEQIKIKRSKRDRAKWIGVKDATEIRDKNGTES